MSGSTYLKDPDATLDYLFDWSDWLASGETITNKVVTVDSGITKNSDTIVSGTNSAGVLVASSAVLVWLTAGTAGVDYKVACRITTSASRIDERTILVKVRQR